MIFCVFQTYLVFGSLRTSLLCILVELAGLRSVAVAISDRLYVNGDMRHVTCVM